MSRPAPRPDKEAYQLLETKSPHVGISLPASDDEQEDDEDATVFGSEGDDDDWLEGLDGHKGRIHRLRDSWADQARRPLVVGVAVAVLFLLAILVAALAHPTSRHVLSSPSRWSLPFRKPPRVQCDPKVSLAAYLDSHFGRNKGKEGETVVMWTMATGSYVPQARNWDLKRAELGMEDAVVVLCLDAECLDECEQGGLRAYGGYLREHIDLPPETSGRMREKRGAERGHFMAFLKFKAMLEMAQSGFPSLFFEGDTFLTTNPFPHMLPLSSPNWDLQFTEDVGYIVNFGWIFARPSEATIKLFQAAFDAYVARNEWDQLLLSNTIINQGGKEWRGEKGDEHWWIVEPLGTRINMLPLDKFQATHPVMLEWYKPDPNAPEPVMNHLTAFFFPNRQFYPKERGWATNIDSFYTHPRPILSPSPISASIQSIMKYARLVHVLARKTGMALQVPRNVTVEWENGDEEGKWTREWTRVVSVEAAMELDLDLLEARFFEHAARYLPSNTLSSWQSNTRTLSLADFDSPTSLVARLIELKEEDGAQGRIVRLDGWEASEAAEWDLGEIEGVEDEFKKVPACEGYHMDHLPFPWCKPLPLDYA
ncbi:hypothetical protein NBRC10512_006992 [Rhodotorula toruloides]|uniref:RHTO0S14e04368g1_1 n=2 Tax=Rhodotorula toruloides TaxID=5286 RepID=A0A061BC28_RHOTO|nr:uncharacterized protein RHTO_05079 [Rhodotorula toruloides NP11]EMS24899.1 hypothetical protein RHTO_05079 [Rhodotorula toruloides NP11]KAJ8297334.1 hypothetical protein OF846_000555 [Rhodotorula toruloides]CDR47504.1 RHTO0S14e04368g1_1 [Rhodotorula toruloides]